MLKLSTLVSLLLLAVPKAVYADPCVAFDADFNLLAFGINGKDYTAGKQDSWSGGECPSCRSLPNPVVLFACELAGRRCDVVA